MSTTKLIDAIESFCKEIDKMKEAIDALASDEAKHEKPVMYCRCGECTFWTRTHGCNGACGSVHAPFPNTEDTFWCDHFQRKVVKPKEPAEMEGFCKDCTYWLSHGYCTFHGESIGGSDGCGEFFEGFGDRKPEKREDTSTPKPKYRDIPIENRGELVAGNIRLSSWFSEISFVGFRYADGVVLPYPVSGYNVDRSEDGAEVKRAVSVVVEV